MATKAAPAQRLIAPLITANGRIAFALGSRTRWRAASDYLFVPIELPGGEWLSDEPPAVAISRLARRWFGCDATLLPSQQLYGPSPQHAIDRLSPTPDDDPLPLLRLERMAPKDSFPADAQADPQTSAIQRVIVRVYQAQPQCEPAPTAGTAGVLWLTPYALRLAIRGAPLADLLALTEHVTLHDSTTQSLTPDERAHLMAYTPSEYGERHLLRIEAKYGARTLWPNAATQEDAVTQENMPLPG